MYATHQKGLLGELEFILFFVKKGFTVLTPVNPNSSYDLVIEKGGKFQRIQIKYCTPSNGRLRVELERPKRKTLPYKKRDVDAIGVYVQTIQKFYLIPLKKVNTKSEIWLRINGSKNKQKKLINLASDYEI